ncbi:MAG: cytochrome P450 [Chloroflexota bacterium]
MQQIHDKTAVSPPNQSAISQSPSGRCPVDYTTFGKQKSARAESVQQPVTVDADGMWHIHSYTIARDLLRSNQTKQAGFRAEQLDAMPNYLKPPVLFMEGKAHQQMRKQTARFFTPATTRKNYRQLMQDLTNDILADLQTKGEADLSKLSLKMAVAVAAQVVGLTDSVIPGLNRRIEAFFRDDAASEQGWTPRKFWNFLRSQQILGSFFLLDVYPAIRVRRKQRQEDVISHLLDRDYGNIEILTEAVTYGAAGMVTTREFISMAFWHLMEQPELKARYLAGEQAERYQILDEILRLEPIVGYLRRRATEAITLDDGKVIPQDALIELHIYDINADETIVGEAGRELCPARDLTPMRPKVPQHVMGFGEGNHRCPGAYIALQETDIFLTQLLSLPNLHIVTPPTVGYLEAVRGYELRNFIISVT